MQGKRTVNYRPREPRRAKSGQCRSEPDTRAQVLRLCLLVLFVDHGAHFLEQVTGEDEVSEALVG